MEGTVTAIRKGEGGFDAFVITVDRDHWRNQDFAGAGRIGKTVYVPMEVACSEWDGRIVKL